MKKSLCNLSKPKLLVGLGRLRNDIVDRKVGDYCWLIGRKGEKLHFKNDIKFYRRAGETVF